MGRLLESIEDAASELELLQRLLPLRPSPEQYDAATAAIARVDNELAERLQALARQKRPDGVPQAAFKLVLEAREQVLRMQFQESKRPWYLIVEAEMRHRSFDQLRQRLRASSENRGSPEHDMERRSFGNGNLLADGSSSSSELPDRNGYHLPADEQLGRSRIYEGLDLASTQRRAVSEITSAVPQITSVEDQSENYVVAEVKKMSTAVGDVQLDQGECPPRLLAIIRRAAEGGSEKLDISEMFTGDFLFIPDDIGQLRNLKVLIMTGNRIVKLPDSIGELKELTVLDVSANQLSSLPYTLGELTKLQKLNIQKNAIEELPYSIRYCEALEELRADFNQLKALPEAVGYLANLRILSVHLNCLKGLPTTIGYLSELTELDAHFNQIESLPESLCFLANLKKLNVASNFHALRALPFTLGHLKELVELDISYNNISELPESFVLLTNLQKLHLEGNPWKIPPLHITQQGKQAVFEYMQERIKQKQQEKVRRKKRNFVLKAIYACSGAVNRCWNRRPDDPTMNILA